MLRHRHVPPHRLKHSGYSNVAFHSGRKIKSMLEYSQFIKPGHEGVAVFRKPHPKRSEHLSSSFDERQDLRNTLLAGGILTAGLGAMAIASTSQTLALQIPSRATIILTIVSLLITFSGLLALRSAIPARPLAYGTLIAYTAIITILVHLTGGPLTPVPALYLVVVVAASFLLGIQGAFFTAVLSIIGYAFILYLEYRGVLAMVPIWELSFSPEERGPLLVVNWLTLSLPTLTTAFLAGTLAERWRRTNQHLRESERLRAGLTDMLIHDLRNPLSSLMGALELLELTDRADSAEGAAEEREELLSYAREGSERLLQLINTMLDLSKMEAGRFEPTWEKVEVAPLVREVAKEASLSASLAEQQIELRLEKPLPTLECDSQLLRRILDNLLSNAIKYTPPGSTILIHVHKAGHHIRFNVIDQGPGIPKAYQEAIFDKFSQVRRSDIRRGTGLGLAFCKMAVEAQGGLIWVESEEGKGSTFSFILPIHHREEGGD